MERERGEVRSVDGQETRSRRLTCGGYAESGACFSRWFRLLFILEGVVLVIFFEEVWGMNVLKGLPGVVTFGVSFPVLKVLERSVPSMTSVVDQMLHLVFLCRLN